jgi:predicted glycosyltransferase
MRILIDIGHPAHVHYFRNAIKILKEKGHQLVVTTRDKEITLDLLNYYGILFVNTGKNKSTVLGKIMSLIKNDWYILKTAVKFKPDILTSFFLPFPSHIGFIIRKPVIGFTDTEHAKLSIKLTEPFTDIIVVPSCYKNDFGRKQVSFNGYMELCYLHTNYFKPNENIYDLLKINRSERYIILRFVSWGAGHDIGERGFSIETKRKIVNELSDIAKVFISSERKLPEEFKKYQIQIPPDRIHDALAYASLYMGESPTMTTESAILGTPAVCVSSWACDCGNFQDLRKYDLIECYVPEDENKALDKAIEILKNINSKDEWEKKRNELLKEKIDVTAFLVWFIENYPESVDIMKENPRYQMRFIN